MMTRIWVNIDSINGLLPYNADISKVQWHSPKSNFIRSTCILRIWTSKITWKITLLELFPHLVGDNELRANTNKVSFQCTGGIIKYEECIMRIMLNDGKLILIYHSESRTKCSLFYNNHNVVDKQMNRRLWVTMMTSLNGNIFRVTGHLCGEFTGCRWIPHTKASDAELWCFLWSASE